MPEPLSDPGSGTDDAALDVLGQVKLFTFKAVPVQIGPFGAAKLSWGVEGPDGFFVELDRRRVSRVGELIVTPATTQTFVLRARAGRFGDVLGKVSVQVDLSSCGTTTVFNVGERIHDALRAGIDNDPTLYFRAMSGSIGQPPRPGGPIVEFQTDRITFKLLLKLKLNNTPDPSVDIRASFGLDVQNGGIVAIDQDIVVDVNVPFYVWLVPGAIIGLPIALDQGKERARENTRSAIRGIVQLLNAIARVAEGQRLHSVRIEVIEKSLADLLLFHCPDELLHGLLDQEVAPA